MGLHHPESVMSNHACNVLEPLRSSSFCSPALPARTKGRRTLTYTNDRDSIQSSWVSRGDNRRARWELPLSFHTEAFESSETEKENYCLLRAEILLSISDPGVRYLFRSSHFSLARAGSALHTCVFVTRSVLSDSACQPARLCNLIHSFVLHKC